MNSKHKYIIEDPDSGFTFVDDKMQREKTEKTIQIMNKNSNLGYDLLCPYENEIIKKIEKESKEYISNYMSNDYYNDGIKWNFSGYPHDEANYFLTEINFSSDKYNVFGIKPGDVISNSVKTLKAQGFEKSKNCPLEWVNNAYEKDNLYIYLITQHDYDEENGDKEKIIKIIIEVETLYLGNRIY